MSLCPLATQVSYSTFDCTQTWFDAWVNIERRVNTLGQLEGVRLFSTTQPFLFLITLDCNLEWRQPSVNEYSPCAALSVAKSGNALFRCGVASLYFCLIIFPSNRIGEKCQWENAKWHWHHQEELRQVHPESTTHQVTMNAVHGVYLRVLLSVTVCTTIASAHSGQREYSFRKSRLDDSKFPYVTRSHKPYYFTDNIYSNGQASSFPSTFVQSPSVPVFSARSSFPTTISPSVIKHPGTCSHDRSQAACSFNIICHLANGVSVEKCENNSSMTCCYLHSNQLASKYSWQPNYSTNSMNTRFDSSKPIDSFPFHKSIPAQPLNYQPSPALSESTSSLSSFKYPSSKYFQYSPKSLEPSFANSYRLKTDSIAQYETKPISDISRFELDQTNDAVRSTRPQFDKTFFQEIASRKLYARHYQTEDSKWFFDQAKF